MSGTEEEKEYQQELSQCRFCRYEGARASAAAAALACFNYQACECPDYEGTTAALLRGTCNTLLATVPRAMTRNRGALIATRMCWRRQPPGQVRHDPDIQTRSLPARHRPHRHQLETGIRPWMKPWSAEHAAGRITRPLRGNGVPYQGINVLMLWGAAMEQGYSAPIWLTFKQALALGGSVRKGEHGSLVVFASTFTRTEANEATGEESERDIPFLKGYTVFNVEQIDGLPAQYLAPAAPRLDPVQRVEHAEQFFAAMGATVRHGGDKAYYRISTDEAQLPTLKPSGTRKAITPPWRMS